MTILMTNLEQLNAMSSESFRVALTQCCGAHRWVDEMVKCRPFESTEALFKAAEEIWFRLSPEDWLEAFTHHPKIGDINSLRAKFQNTRHLAENEQSGVQTATEETLNALANGNVLYEKKFGYIFIVCATGKSAAEMLAILESRLDNPPDVELNIAAQEQNKITRLRLEKL